jgi:soluble lytic murein transglycosylase-like protein
MRGAKLTVALGVSVMSLFLAGLAGAQSAEVPGVKNTEAPVHKTGIPQQKAALKGEVGEGAPYRADAAPSRDRDLEQQTQGKAPEVQREAATPPQVQRRQQTSAGEGGRDLGGIPLVPGSLSDGDGKTPDTDPGDPDTRAQDKGREDKGRESARSQKDSLRASKETDRRPDQKKYRESRESKEKQRAEESRRETKPGGSGGRPDPKKKEQMEARLAQLRAAERAGAFTMPPASGTGANTEYREQELQIAQEEIVALPVEPIPYRRYVQIYKASAKRYGFEDEWYILAAVGQVESNHGRNMGPSSAGALGPMQFLPSTWRDYGIDGNGDDVANIYDPRDAIPSAASYLEVGGAPNDWYKALYTYNHSAAYVRKVLGVAEGYRRLAEDGKIEPKDGEIEP